MALVYLIALRPLDIEEGYIYAGETFIAGHQHERIDGILCDKGLIFGYEEKERANELMAQFKAGIVCGEEHGPL